jgi:hypothetical protein
LIIKKDADEGRSPLLSTTKKFQEYFRLSGDGKSLRTELRKKDKTEDIQPVTADAQAIQLQLDEAINIQLDDVQVPAASTDDPQIAAAASAGGEPISLEIEAAQATAAATGETISFEVEPDAILPTGTVRKLTEIFDASPDNTLVFQPDAKASDASDDKTVVPPSPTTESANN